MSDTKTRSIIEQEFINKKKQECANDIVTLFTELEQKLRKKYLAVGHKYIISEQLKKARLELGEAMEKSLEYEAEEYLKKVGQSLYEDQLAKGENDSES